LRGWVVTHNGKVTRFYRGERALIWTSCGTLFPSYGAARNAMRMSQRTDRRMTPLLSERVYRIHRVQGEVMS
jgi:hypothetical protein